MSEIDVEALIESASQLKDAVTRLGDAYELMPAVIEKEHRAIRSSDFAEVQAAVEQKEEAGQRVESAFGELTRASDRLARLAPEGKRPTSLKECVATLQSLVARVADESLPLQVLRHQVEGLARVAAEFEQRFSRIKPQIEANRALVGTLLTNIQESYRFWQEVVEQEVTAYNAQGVQKAKGRNSGFAVKA